MAGQVTSAAEELAGQAPLAVGAIKEASAKPDLDEGIEAEKAAFAAAFASEDAREGIEAEKQGFATAFFSEDAKEGISAFLGKRTPKWSGR